MPSKLRKLIGAVVILGFLVFYSLLAMSIAVAYLPGTSHWVQALYYLVAGIIWAFPMMPVVTWMQRENA